MSNLTSSDIPPLAQYTLQLRPPLLSPIPDKVLILLLPVAAYWIVSLFFHYIDTNDYLPQYRLHPPAEVLKRNRVSRAEVVRDVLTQQVIQMLTSFVLGMMEPEDYEGDEMYRVTIWAQRIRLAQKAVPNALALIGIDSVSLARHLGSYPQVAGALAGGQYPTFWDKVSLGAGQEAIVPAFAGWELVAAKALYWFLIPATQFALAIVFIDTWQYFLHRAMHVNQWMYRTFHSRHHRLYVPYAFGALYNHPFEGFLLDTLGAGIAYLATGLSTRQAMWLFTCSIIKTVDDHCGYALPWDPLQRITSNNAGYHDIHHQTWGIKTNFSQPFFTFWDHLMGTAWTGGDVSARYARTQKAAQQEGDHSLPESDMQNLECEKRIVPPGKARQQAIESMSQVLQDHESGGPSVVFKEAAEEREAELALERNQRKRTTNSAPQTGSLKTLKDRVHGSLHGRAGTIIGLESSQ